MTRSRASSIHVLVWASPTRPECTSDGTALFLPHLIDSVLPEDQPGVASSLAQFHIRGRKVALPEKWLAPIGRKTAIGAVVLFSGSWLIFRSEVGCRVKASRRRYSLLSEVGCYAVRGRIPLVSAPCSRKYFRSSLGERSIGTSRRFTVPIPAPVGRNPLHRESGCKCPDQGPGPNLSGSRSLEFAASRLLCQIAPQALRSAS
jgi:hypothetical protein